MLECKECGYKAKNLHLHIKNTHNLTKEEYYKKYNCDSTSLFFNKLKCEGCGTLFGSLINTKNYCSKSCLRKINLLKKYTIKEYNNLPTCKICGDKTPSMATHLQNHKDVNLKQYCEMFGIDQFKEKEKLFSADYLKKLSDNVSGDKNPVYIAQKKYGKNALSPFSKDFIKYDNLNETDKKNAIKSTCEKSVKTANENNNNNCTIEYYTSRGMTDEEAEKALAERQRTFTLKKCIEKHGPVEGKRIWQERQNKWQETMKTKPQEEIDRINSLKSVTEEFYINKYGPVEGKKLFKELSASKAITLQNLINKYGEIEGTKRYNDWLINITPGSAYSKISQELFWVLYEEIKNDYKDIYFAELGDKHNNEWWVRTNKQMRMLDFYIKDLNICIEFDGEYWHNDEDDYIREQEILEVNPTMKILHIKEIDYYKNKENETQRCLDFINDNKIK
jgi:hypothetical protein